MQKPFRLALALALLGAAAPAPQVLRQVAQAPGADLLVAAEVPPGLRTVYLSGKLAAVADPSAPAGSLAAYGDMRRQTVSIFTKIDATLGHHGMSLRDVVRMTVYLVGDPAAGGTVDRAGFIAGYAQFFGTTRQPNLPARTIVQVAGLDQPGYRVAVDVVAAGPPAGR